jgi:serine/threonine protein phosphatase PrpC
MNNIAYSIPGKTTDPTVVAFTPSDHNGDDISQFDDNELINSNTIIETKESINKFDLAAASIDESLVESKEKPMKEPKRKSAIPMDINQSDIRLFMKRKKPERLQQSLSNNSNSINDSKIAPDVRITAGDFVMMEELEAKAAITQPMSKANSKSKPKQRKHAKSKAKKDELRDNSATQAAQNISNPVHAAVAPINSLVEEEQLQRPNKPDEALQAAPKPRKTRAKRELPTDSRTENKTNALQTRSIVLIDPVSTSSTPTQPLSNNSEQLSFAKKSRKTKEKITNKSPETTAKCSSAPKKRKTANSKSSQKRKEISASVGAGEEIKREELAVEKQHKRRAKKPRLVAGTKLEDNPNNNAPVVSNGEISSSISTQRAKQRINDKSNISDQLVDNIHTLNNNSIASIAVPDPELPGYISHLLSCPVSAHFPANSFYSSYSLCGATTTGYFRSLNQDSFHFSQLFSGQNSPALLAAIFDGHGGLGENAAQLCAELLPGKLQCKMLEKDPIASENCEFLLKQCLNELHQLLLSFAKAEKFSFNALLRSAEKEFKKQLHLRASQRNNNLSLDFPLLADDFDYGTTAAVAFLLGNSLHCVNVGDSRVVLLRRTVNFRREITWKCEFCSVDHDPTVSLSERSRVLAEKGQLITTSLGEVRVFPNNLSLQAAREKKLTLNMSRALGHTVLNQHGVSPRPDYYEISVEVAPISSPSAQFRPNSNLDSPEIEFYLLLGSDGVFDQLNLAQIQAQIDQNCENHGELGELLASLLGQADNSWRKTKFGDNCTLIVGRFVARGECQVTVKVSPADDFNTENSSNSTQN